MAFPTAQLFQLAKAEKSLVGKLSWSASGLDWQEARSQLLVPNLNVSPLYLRIRCPRRESLAGFMLQVEYQPGPPRTTQQLERLEWRVAHTNPNLGPPDLRLSECPSTHLHEFELNYIIDEGRMRRGNLPLARSVEPDPQTIEQFLAFGQESLRIKGLTEIRVPAFQRRFLP